MAAQSLAGESVALVPLTRTDRPEARSLLTGLAQAWVNGLDVDWTRVLGTGGPLPELPTYAFDHTRYWLDRSTHRGGDLAGVGLAGVEHGLVAVAAELASSGSLMLSGRLTRTAQPWLADHTAAGRALLPDTAFVDLVLQAGEQAGCGRLKELAVQAPLLVPVTGAVDLQVVAEAPDADG
ncbi:hypothetical protein, partial [Kitasatospora putterlickiae]